MSRVGYFLDDLARLAREEGPFAAAKLLGKRVYERTDNLLFEMRTTGAEPELPEGMRIHHFSSKRDPDLDLLVRAGGGKELGNFRRRAVAYVLCVEGEPVARGWYFPRNALARKLDGAQYLGSAFVRPEWRGKGLNAMLLQGYARSVPPGTRLVMQVAASNTSSQQSLSRLGLAPVGRVSTLVVLGRLVNVRIDPLPRKGTPPPVTGDPHGQSDPRRLA